MKQEKKQPRANVRAGALVVLSVCFVASAMLRAGDVVAALPSGGDDGFGNPIPTTQDTGPNQATSPEAAPQTMPPVMLAELKRRETALEDREAEIEMRERTLELLEDRLGSRLDEIRAARERLANTAALVDDAAGKDVRLLAAMYQQMKPKQAGQIFNEMAPSFAAGFMAEMRPDAAALILANMEAEKAYAVSLLMAGRNLKPQRNAPTQ